MKPCKVSVKFKAWHLILLIVAILGIAFLVAPIPHGNVHPPAIAAVEQSPAPIVPAMPGQSSANPQTAHSRAVDQFTLSGSEDYSALKLHYQAAADAGDPVARRIIAQIYDFCALYSHSPTKFSGQMDVLAAIRPEWSAQLEGIKTETAKRCGKLDGGELITRELLDFNWAQAVAAHDAVATLQVAARQTDLDGRHLDQLLDKFLPSADPETLFEVGNLVDSNQSSIRFEKFSNPFLGPYAWQILACRRGGPALCGANSPLLMARCINGICTGGMDYEQSVRATLPPIDQARLDNMISELDRFLSGGK